MSFGLIKINLLKGGVVRGLAANNEARALQIVSWDSESELQSSEAEPPGWGPYEREATVEVRAKLIIGIGECSRGGNG